jgi:hypothetical protein
LDQDDFLVDDVIRYLNWRDWLKAQNPDIGDQPPPDRPARTDEEFEARVAASVEAAGMKVEELG